MTNLIDVQLRSTHDAAFRQALQDRPRQTLLEVGVALPADVIVEVKASSHQVWHLCSPPALDPQEALTDQQLEAATGGAGATAAGITAKILWGLVTAVSAGGTAAIGYRSSQAAKQAAS